MMPEINKYCTKEKAESFRYGLYEASFRLTEFDTYITAPMFGYKSNMDYYKSSTVSG